jgi:hypothetical protein
MPLFLGFYLVFLYTISCVCIEHTNIQNTLAIYTPMIYTAPCVMFGMRADQLRGQVGEGWVRCGNDILPNRTRMLSLILRRIFFCSLGRKIFFFVKLLRPYSTWCQICYCQLRFFFIFAVLGTLKIIENIEFLMRMHCLYAYPGHTHQFLMQLYL